MVPFPAPTVSDSLDHGASLLQVLSNGAVEMELMGVLHRATFEERLPLALRR